MKQFLVFLSLGGAVLYTLLVIADNLIPNGPVVESRSTPRRLSVWGPYLPYRSMFQAQQAPLTAFAPSEGSSQYSERTSRSDDHPASQDKSAASQIGGDAEREAVERAKVKLTAWVHSEASATSHLISSPASMPPMTEPETSGTQNIAVRSPSIMPDDPQTARDDDQIGERASLPIAGDTFGTSVPSEGAGAIWLVVSRTAWLHADPSVSSPITHFYPVGTELKLIGYEQGWFHVSDPATLRQGWIYEKYYLEAIRGPGQMRVAVQDLPSPTRVALAKPKPSSWVKKRKPKQKIAKPRPQQKIAKSRTKRDKRIRIASARIQNESVASLMERAFREY